MKYNKLLKKALALGLVATMAAVPAPIMAAGDGEVIVDNAVEKGLIDVELPTALVFAIDPMEIISGDGQIASNDFAIYNRSNFAIQVDATASLKLNDDIKLHPAADMLDATKKLTEGTQKNIYMGISVPKTGGITAKLNGKDIATKDDNSRDVEFLYEKIADNKTKGLEAEINENGATVSIKLDAAKLTDGAPDYTGTEANSRIGAVKFVGLVNTNASWKDSDITANMVFDISGISALDYAAATPVANSENAIRLVKGIEEVLPTLGTPAVTAADREVKVDINVSAAKSKIDVRPTRVTSIAVASGLADKKDGTEVAYDTVWDEKAFTSTYDGTNGSEKIAVVMGGDTVIDTETADTLYDSVIAGEHNVKLTYDNGCEQVMKITFVAAPK